MADKNRLQYEEYDPPLPKKTQNPTKEDIERLKELALKYSELAKKRKAK